MARVRRTRRRGRSPRPLSGDARRGATDRAGPSEVSENQGSLEAARAQVLHESPASWDASWDRPSGVRAVAGGLAVTLWWGVVVTFTCSGQESYFLLAILLFRVASMS